MAMTINRRQFLLLTAGLTAGCQSTGSGNSAQGKTVNVGAASRYAADGVYSRYRDAGIFVIRQGDKLFAISSYCTHRKCKLSAEADRSFYCPCHGSTFDPQGHVTKGPARLDLPVFSIASNDQGDLLVQMAASK
jgi:cytochrome b6-f complex iron-sulfur subunit